jgi:hypothetical protein
VAEIDVGSMLPSALSSLDGSVSLYRESLEKLSAASSFDIAELIEQFEAAAESAQHLRALISSERPEISWQNRQELEAVVAEEIQKSMEARDLEQRRFRLMALATELERGSFVRRRAVRANQLNQLRDEAVSELRAQAGLDGSPPTLPGPEPHDWVDWACGLQEPEDAEPLQILRDGFPHLDDFVAHLDPSLWIPVGSEASERARQSPKLADQPQPQASGQETNGLGGPVSPVATATGSMEATLTGGNGQPTVSASTDQPSASPLPGDAHPANGVTSLPTDTRLIEEQQRPPLIPTKIFGETGDAPTLEANVSSESEEAWESAQRMRQSSLLRGNPLGNMSMMLMRPEADLFQSRRLRNTFWIAAMIAFVVAVAMLGFGISLHRQMKKLSADVTQSSEANKQAIEAGIQRDQRAWVGLSETTVHPLADGGGGFTIKFQNTGKTPALDMQFADVITIEDTDQVAPSQEPNITAAAGTLMPGASYSADVWFKTSPEVVTGLTRGKLRASNYVYVTYKDIFKQTHTTKACFYWHGGLVKPKACDRYNELN